MLKVIYVDSLAALGASAPRENVKRVRRTQLNWDHSFTCFAPNSTTLTNVLF